MTSYKPGELVLVAFPFAGSDRSKLRPALVIADTGDDDVVLARVTTQSHETSFDVPVTEWKDAGLLAPSEMRLHKLATIEKKLIARRLGNLQASDRTSVANALQRLCAGW